VYYVIYVVLFYISRSITLFAYAIIIFQFFQAFHTKINYLSWENALELTIFVCSLLLVLDVKSCQNSTGYRFVSILRQKQFQLYIIQ